ncbi:unnamed protein product [Ambrosiozyma monospora]|uniref:Unnamed protein product n=1 Tax=Ambrosiozyma monospora TaxID=43982 RepID=A0ACB5U865_AMBMO|nr:unnamed protein product [Ambrosiozyma monospora]
MKFTSCISCLRLLPLLMALVPTSSCYKMTNIESYNRWLNNIAENAYISLIEPQPGDRTITILEINADTGRTLSSFVARFNEDALPVYLSEVTREDGTGTHYYPTTQFSTTATLCSSPLVTVTSASDCSYHSFPHLGPSEQQQQHTQQDQQPKHKHKHIHNQKHDPLITATPMPTPYLQVNQHKFLIAWPSGLL